MLYLVYGGRGRNTVAKILSKNFNLQIIHQTTLYENGIKKVNNIHGISIIDNLEIWEVFKKYYMTKLILLFSYEFRREVCDLSACIKLLASSDPRKIIHLTNYDKLEGLIEKTNRIKIFNEQLERDIYFMEIAIAVSNIYKCVKRNVGSIIVKNNRIVSTGYNGTPKNIKNCTEGACEYCNREINVKMHMGDCICIHSELAAILDCDKNLLKDSTIYTTTFPCRECSKHIIQAGINKVVYFKEYKRNENDHLMKILFKSAGISIYHLIKIDDPTTYELLKIQ